MSLRLRFAYCLFILLALFAYCWFALGVWAVLPVMLLLLAQFLLCALPWFVLMHRVNRSDAAPRARVAQVLAVCWSEFWLMLVVIYWRQLLRHRALPDWLPAQPTGRRGVVLVHGLLCNRGLWLPWLARLRAQRHAYASVNLKPVYPTVPEYAAALDDAVQRVRTCLRSGRESSKCPFGRSTVLRCLPIATAMVCTSRLASHPEWASARLPARS